MARWLLSIREGFCEIPWNPASWNLSAMSRMGGNWTSVLCQALWGTFVSPGSDRGKSNATSLSCRVMVFYGLPRRQESHQTVLHADLDPVKLRPKFMITFHRPTGRQVLEMGHGHKWLSPGWFTIVASVPIIFFQTLWSKGHIRQFLPMENENP